MVAPELNKQVKWAKGALTLSVLQDTRIRGISPCQRFVLLDWIRNPVPVTELEESDVAIEAKLYHPYTVNQWSVGDIDLASNWDLGEWVKTHNARRI